MTASRRGGSLRRVALAGALTASACGGEDLTLSPVRCQSLVGCATSCDELGPRTDRVLDPARVDDGLGAVRVGLFVARSYPTGGGDELDVSRVESLLRGVVRETEETLAPCGLGVRVEHAEVTHVPASSLSLVANREGAWGGMAPEGEDADAFNHAQNEPLTEPVRRLMAHARRHLSPGAIAIVVVDELSYYAAGERRAASGVSFPPVIFHRAEDIPLRNGVLIGGAYGGCGRAPVAVGPRVVAHELGHMLLDTGTHDADPDNLMSATAGARVRPAQCARMADGPARLLAPAPP